MSELNCLKGDDFLNRYRIEGVLTTAGPFHLGDGFDTDRPGLFAEKENENENERKKARVSTIATDYRNKPLIPGSSLKGALRNFIYRVFSVSACSNTVFADNQNYENLIKENENLRKQENQIFYMKNNASVADRLFGTPFAEGKIEVWDCPCTEESISASDLISNPELPPFWSAERMTFVDQSVAIDPDSGTAIDKKLYHYEVIPPGVSFKMNITGQNLTYIELGLLLFALEAFNSEIWPVTLGGMSGRGFGRFTYNCESIYSLPAEDVKDWIKEALYNDHSGYFSLKKMSHEEKQKIISDAKKLFSKELGGGE